MNQSCVEKQLEPNENLFLILDGWIKKYNTSPYSFEDETLSIKLDEQSKIIVENPYTLSALRDWAVKNKKVVVVTAVSIIIFASSVTITGSKKNISNDNVDDINSLSLEVSDKEDNISVDVSGVYFSKGRMIEESEMVPNVIAPLDIPIHFPSNTFISNYLKRNTNNGLMGNFMDPFIETTDNDFEESTPPEEDNIMPTEEVIITEEVVVTPTVLANGGIEIVIPSSVRQTGLCRNHTSYTYFYGRWNRGSGQRALSEEWGAAGKPSSNGIATLNGRYLVAVSPKFGKVGDNIDVVLSDGQIIPATIADGKGSDATSEWGHVMTSSGAVDIIEWESTGAKSDINLGTWSNVTVAKIVNYGKDLPQYDMVSLEDNSINEEAQQYIKLYSSIYGLDSEKVYQILSDATDNFNNEQYQQYNNIVRFGDSKSMICNSKEMAILLSTRDIYYNPGQYGVNLAEIKGANLYSSSQSYLNQIEYFSDILGVDASLNYSIYEASNSLNNSMFMNQNNPTGIMINGSYATFPTIAAGFVEQTIEIKGIILAGQDPVEIIEARLDTNQTLDVNTSELYNSLSNNFNSILGYGDINSDSNLKKYTLS